MEVSFPVFLFSNVGPEQLHKVSLRLSTMPSHCGWYAVVWDLWMPNDFSVCRRMVVLSKLRLGRSV